MSENVKKEEIDLYEVCKFYKSLENKFLYEEFIKRYGHKYDIESNMHHGYIWAPYIPLITTPTIFDPNKFNPQKGIMTRDGKSSINPKFYGTLGDVK